MKQKKYIDVKLSAEWDQFVEDPKFKRKIASDLITKEMIALGEGDQDQKDLCYALARLDRFFSQNYQLFLEIKTISINILAHKGPHGLAIFSNKIADLEDKVWPDDIVMLGEVFMEVDFKNFIYVLVTYFSWKNVNGKLFDMFIEFYREANPHQREMLLELDNFYGTREDLFEVSIKLVKIITEKSTDFILVLDYLRALDNRRSLSNEIIAEIKDGLIQNIDPKILLQMVQIQVRSKRVVLKQCELN